MQRDSETNENDDAIREQSGKFSRYTEGDWIAYFTERDEETLIYWRFIIEQVPDESPTGRIMTAAALENEHYPRKLPHDAMALVAALTLPSEEYLIMRDGFRESWSRHLGYTDLQEHEFLCVRASEETVDFITNSPAKQASALMLVFNLWNSTLERASPWFEEWARRYGYRPQTTAKELKKREFWMWAQQYYDDPFHPSSEQGMYLDIMLFKGLFDESAGVVDEYLGNLRKLRREITGDRLE